MSPTSRKLEKLALRKEEAATPNPHQPKNEEYDDRDLTEDKKARLVALPDEALKTPNSG